MNIETMKVHASPSRTIAVQTRQVVSIELDKHIIKLELKSGRVKEVECCDIEQAVTTYNTIIEQWGLYSIGLS